MATIKDIDQSILKEWYDKQFRVPGMPNFEELSGEDKTCFASTTSFAVYKLGKAQDKFKKAIVIEVEQFIKFIVSLFKK